MKSETVLSRGFTRMHFSMELHCFTADVTIEYYIWLPISFIIIFFRFFRTNLFSSFPTFVC